VGTNASGQVPKILNRVAFASSTLPTIRSAYTGIHGAGTLNNIGKLSSLDEL